MQTQGRSARNLGQGLWGGLFDPWRWDPPLVLFMFIWDLVEMGWFFLSAT